MGFKRDQMPVVSDGDNLVPRYDGSVSKPNNTKSHNSKSWLSKKFGLGRTRQTSSETLTFEIEHSMQSMEPLEERIEGGCLKIPTQQLSLNTEYHRESVGLDQDRPSVSFGSIEVLTFPLTLGDNPAVSVGPPLAVGGPLHSRETVSVDDYESTRPPRRAKDSLVVPKMMRFDWLRDEGFSRGELREVEEEILAIKKSRKANSCGLKSKLFLRLFGSTSLSNGRSSTLRK